MSPLKPQNATLVISEFSRKQLRKFFGRVVSDVQLAALVGALDDAVVEISFSRSSFEAVVKHEYIVEQYRIVGSASNLGFFINNVFFELVADAPDGLGLLSFVRQVAAAGQLGFSFIRTFAEGYFGDPNNFIGYYVWARFGFNAPLEPDEIAGLPPELEGCEDLNAVMLRGGEAWWRQVGTGRDMIFMLSDDEPSVNVLRGYLAEKGTDLSL